jgi:hypothetical protein
MGIMNVRLPPESQQYVWSVNAIVVNIPLSLHTLKIDGICIAQLVLTGLPERPSYSVGTGDDFPRVKRLEREADHLPSSSPEFRNNRYDDMSSWHKDHFSYLH